MKYLCLGYIEENKWDTMSKDEREAMIEECFAYDDELKKNGHFVRGEALRSPRSAVTLRWRNGKASFTDGPYAETKEQIGGLLAACRTCENMTLYGAWNIIQRLYQTFHDCRDVKIAYFLSKRSQFNESPTGS